jgi:ankyrin repeat protein
MMLASANGHIKILKLLTDAGADISFKNIEGNTARNLARTDECATFLSDQQKIIKKFILAALRGRKNKVEKYRNQGAHVNDTDDDGYTALHYAANRSNQSTLNFLLEEGANVRKASVSGITPLHIAARNPEKAIIDAILSKRSDVNSADTQNLTPLMYAARSGNLYNVKILLDYGANPKLKNLKGQTALDLARNENMNECIEMLMDPNDNLNESHPSTISEMRNEMETFRTHPRENEDNLASAKVDKSLKRKWECLLNL